MILLNIHYQSLTTSISLFVFWHQLFIHFRYILCAFGLSFIGMFLVWALIQAMMFGFDERKKLNETKQ